MNINARITSAHMCYMVYNMSIGPTNIYDISIVCLI